MRRAPATATAMSQSVKAAGSAAIPCLAGAARYSMGGDKVPRTEDGAPVVPKAGHGGTLR
jgi:hypothetical protein